ncbi:MAG: o-succinylbenzoate synthase [Acidobacteria bacterium]|nr:o-succinylbenzoate synthase [Acidobacteriota bacterium]
MDQSLLESMRVIALPTKTNFRGINLREVALFQGEYGWGEFSPFLEYDFQECVPWLMSAIEAASQPRPELLRTSIRVNGTIPALDDKSEIEKIIESFPGVETFKIKVGDNLQADLVRLARVKSLRPKARLRIDVNGSWTVSQAVTHLRAIFENVGPLEYVEQPCATIEELRELKERLITKIPIAGDEVVRKAVDPFAINLNGAVDIVMLKVAPLGGISRARRLAEHHKLPVVVSSALESAVGIHYGLTLAATLKNLEFDCGLGTGSLLAADVAHLPIENGAIRITDFEPHFNGYEVAPDRFNWWKNRVMKTAELING